MMKAIQCTMPFLLLSLVAATAAPADAIELRRTHRIGNPDPDRESAWPRHVDYLSWIDDDTIVYWVKTGRVVCRNIRTDTQLWSADGIYDVRSWSVARKNRRLAILHRPRSEPEFAHGFRIQVLDADTGKSLFSAGNSVERPFDFGSDQLAKLLGLSYAMPVRLALAPDDGRLIICNLNREFGRNAYVLDPTYSKVVGTFDIDASPEEITVSPDGARVAVLADDEALCIRRIKSNDEIYFTGRRILKTSESSPGHRMIDVPHASHVRHDGANLLVYAVDGGWGPGVVNIVDLKTKQTKSFNTRNGHIEIDVDFARRRIALTGTERALTVVDFDGNEIAEFPDAGRQRNTCVEFSPGGKRIAVGSWDTSLTIFSLEE